MVNNKQTPISLDEAKKIAEEAARLNLSGIVSDSTKLLSDQYLEAEHCWMFFRNPKIIVPPEASLRGDWAYAVSKHGEVRDIADLSGDHEKLYSYLAKMSEYFKSKAL